MYKKLIQIMRSFRVKDLWACLWMHFAGLRTFGRIATRLATWFVPPYIGRSYLARLNPKGYISPSATIYHADLKLGANIFIDNDVMIFQDNKGGPLEIGDRVHIHRGTFIQTGTGGCICIGEETHIQPRCQLSAYGGGSIQIGRRVEIAPNCAFYPYNHTIFHQESIRNQPCYTKGGIIIGDDAWLGFGVIVLDGVRVGKGAVVGAGAVVTRDIPDNAIAVGTPARVVKMRTDIAINNSERRNPEITQ